MSTTELIEMIKKMPADKQKEVEDFVLSKINIESIANYTLSDTNHKAAILAEPSGEHNRGYGSLKGKIWMSDDFNEPLDDFKDYM